MCAKEAEESRCPATMLTGYGKDAGTQSEQASGPVTGTCGGWGGGLSLDNETGLFPFPALFALKLSRTNSFWQACFPLSSSFNGS